MTFDAYSIKLFGRPTLHCGDEEITFKGRDVELLFIRLALAAGGWVTRTQQLDALFEEEAGRPEQRVLVKRLGNHRSRLKHALGPGAAYILEEKSGQGDLRLAILEGSSVDAAVVIREVKHARDAAYAEDWQVVRDAARCVDEATDAQFAENRGEHWIRAERERFCRFKLEALQHLAQAELNATPANPYAAREAARKLMWLDDGNIRGLMLLMISEARCGSPEAAQRILLEFKESQPAPKAVEELSEALARNDDRTLATASYLELVPEPPTGPPPAPAEPDPAPDEPARPPTEPMSSPAASNDDPGPPVPEPPPRAAEPDRQAERPERPAARITRRRALALALVSLIAIGVGWRKLGSTSAARHAKRPETVARRALDAFASGDIDALKELLHRDVVFTERVAGRPDSTYNGRDEVLERLAALRGAFSELEAKVPPQIPRASDRLSYAITWSGYQVSPIPPDDVWLNGKRAGHVTLEALMQSSVDDGLIASIEHGLLDEDDRFAPGR